MCYKLITNTVCSDCGKKHTSTTDKICQSSKSCRRPLAEKSELIKQVCSACKPYTSRESTTRETGSRAVAIIKESGRPNAHANGDADASRRVYPVASTQNGTRRQDTGTAGQSKTPTLIAARRPDAHDSGRTIRLDDSRSKTVTKANTGYGTSDNLSRSNTVSKTDPRPGVADNYSRSNAVTRYGISDNHGRSTALVKADSRQGNSNNYNRSNAVTKAEPRNGIPSFDALLAAIPERCSSGEYEMESEIHIRRVRVRVSKGTDSREVVSRDPVSFLGDRFSSMGISDGYRTYRPRDSDRSETVRPSRGMESSYGSHLTWHGI